MDYINDWERIFRTYLKRRTEYIQYHNDEAADIFKSEFLSEAYLADKEMLDPKYKARARVLVPDSPEERLAYAENILTFCTNEIQKYVYGFWHNILILCCREKCLPNEMSMGMICELKSVYRADFKAIRPSFDRLNSKRVLDYMVSLGFLCEQNYI